MAAAAAAADDQRWGIRGSVSSPEYAALINKCAINIGLKGIE